MDKQAMIDKIKAKHAEEVARGKASMESAVAKARTKKPIADVDLDRMKAKVVGEGEKSLKAKVKTARSAAPKPKLTIVEELSQIKAEPPVRPLAGQGSMEGKPVTPSTVKVPEAAAQGVTPEKVKAFNAARDADRRLKQGKAPSGVERRAAPEKVMTPEVKVETPKPAAAKPAGPPKMTAADLGYEAPKPPGPPKMTAHDLFGAPEGPKPSLAAKAGTRLRTIGRTVGGELLESIKSLDPTKPYRELGTNRTSWQVAKAGMKGIGKTAKGLGEGILVQFAADKGWDVGTAINKAFEGDIGGEISQRRAAEAAGYRLEGTHERGWSAVGKGLVGTLSQLPTLGFTSKGWEPGKGAEPGDLKETRLVEDPALKAKAVEKQRAKIRSMGTANTVVKNGRVYTRGPSKGGYLPK